MSNATVPTILNNPFGSTLWTGTNFQGVIDIDPTGQLVTGRTVLAQRLVLRQTTPLGSVFDSPNDCFDVDDWLSNNQTDTQLTALATTIQQQLLRDQEVQGAVVQLTFVPETSTLTVVEQIQSGQGPFSLTLTITPSGVTALVGQITGPGQYQGT